MRRCLLLVLAVLGLAFALPAEPSALDPVIDRMDENHFRAPKEKATVALVEGKVGKAVRFAFDKGSQSVFCGSNLRGRPDWDRAEGFSFWVKGVDGFGGLEFIYADDYSLRYDFCFPVRGTEWKKVTVAWRDLVPALPGANSKPLGVGPGLNPPSKVSALWFGRWWYWRDYPAMTFSIDEINLEPKIEERKIELPPGAPLERVLAKLKAGKPVTITTVGDSLTDTHHWANQKISWPALLQKKLEEKYKSTVKIVNPAIGGTQLRQNLVLMPRWLEKDPEPDLVTFCFGGNDWDAGMRGEQFRASNEDAIGRVRRATQGKSDILLMTTVPNVKAWETMKELAQGCREAAKAGHAELADTEQAFHAAGKENKERLYAWDRVHLSPEGHELMARKVLEAIEKAGK